MTISVQFVFCKNGLTTYLTTDRKAPAWRDMAIYCAPSGCFEGPFGATRELGCVLTDYAFFLAKVAKIGSAEKQGKVRLGQ